jgi:hypothetical protein
VRNHRNLAHRSINALNLEDSKKSRSAAPIECNVRRGFSSGVPSEDSDLQINVLCVGVLDQRVGGRQIEWCISSRCGNNIDGFVESEGRRETHHIADQDNPLSVRECGRYAADIVKRCRIAALERRKKEIPPGGSGPVLFIRDVVGA